MKLKEELMIVTNEVNFFYIDVPILEKVLPFFYDRNHRKFLPMDIYYFRSYELVLTPNNLELHCKVKYYIDHYLDRHSRHRPTLFFTFFVALLYYSSGSFATPICV